MGNLARMFLVGLVALTAALYGCTQAGFMNHLGAGNATDGLVDFALADNGARVVVSQETPGHSAVSLIDGITGSADGTVAEEWQQPYGKQLLVRQRASGG